MTYTAVLSSYFRCFRSVVVAACGDVSQLIPSTEEEASYFYKRKFSIVNGMHTVLGFMTLREKAPGVRGRNFAG